MEDLTGKQLGKYRVVAPLGEGGMAAVYKAYQAGMDRHVALKILPRHFAADPEFVGRFEQEAKVIAKLQHVYILPVHDYGEDEGYTFIVMPFVERGTLDERLDDKPIPLPEIRKIISQVGDALDYAHSCGLVHRDVKPSNVLIDRRGNCLLTDFGISKMVEGTSKFTQTGAIIGTPEFMSPEQILGEELDGRSDIYSLGVLLYQLATGIPPFRAETPPAVFVKHLHDPLSPPRLLNPEIPEALENVILKALARNRDDRFTTVGEMVKSLQAAIPLAMPMHTVKEDADAAALPTVIESVGTEAEIVTHIPVQPDFQETEVKTQARRALPSWEFGLNRRVVWAVCIVLVVVGIIYGIRVLSAEGEKTPSATGTFTTSSSPTERNTENEATSIFPTNAKIQALNPSGQRVVFWHIWNRDPVRQGMVDLVNEFNATNEWSITVEAYDKGEYSDTMNLFNSAIQSGNLPDLVVAYGNVLDNWKSMEVIIDLEPYVSDPDWGLTLEEASDFYPVTLAGGVTVDGARVGFPISQTAEVLFYNLTWGQELGFEGPPTTPAEFKEQACAGAAANAADDDPDNDGTGGYVLYAGASQISVWMFSYGGFHLTDDGSAWTFNTPELTAVAEFLKELWDEGCAFLTESYPNPEFATRKALMVSSSTLGLPYQLAAFDDAGTADEWSFIAFPGEKGLAVDSYPQIVGMVGSTPERELASWLFLKWFTQPEQQARWIEASAYYPTREGTVSLLDAYAADNPQWTSGLELIPLGQSEPAIASWVSVRLMLQDAFSEIIQGTPDMIPDILADLDEAAAEAMAEME
jgi:multiple sugar transport system substrate-binding protein/sn-glycerol 3-phosphate transport system substrate-binding protein